MTDNNPQDTSSRGFFKGARRASFSPTPAVVPASVSSPVPEPVAGPVAAAEATPQQPGAQPTTHYPLPTTTSKKGKSGKLVLFGLVGILVAMGLSVSFKMYWDSQQKLAKLQTANPEVFSEFEADALVAKVARHMLLPNEKPLINTVSEVEKLRGEPFYAQAENGDKVLVFSRRAILYSPVQDRIIEIGFIRTTTPTPVAEQQAEDASPSAAQAGEGETVAGASTQQSKVLFDNTPKTPAP